MLPGMAEWMMTGCLRRPAVDVVDAQPRRVANVDLDAADLAGLAEAVDGLVVDVHHPVPVVAVLQEVDEHVGGELAGDLLNGVGRVSWGCSESAGSRT